MFSTFMIAAIFYISGIYFADGPGIGAAIFIFIALLVATTIKKSYRRVLFIAAFAILLGAFRYGAAAETPLLRQFYDKYVTADGTVVSQHTRSLGEYRNRYTIELERLSFTGTAYKTNYRVIINTKEVFEFGDKVRVSGFLSEIRGIDNEFEYDFSAYYKSRNICARIVAREAEKTGEGFLPTPEFLAGKIKNYAAKVIDRHYSANRAALLKAILLNDKSGFDREYEELLVRTGVYRSLYSPFMHISFIFLISGIFFKERKTKEQLVIVLLILYALLNSTSPTILKASAISVIMIFRKEIFGFANKLDVLSLIVLVLTICDPMLCFTSGFVISVLSTTMIYFSYSPIYRSIAKFFAKKNLHMPRVYWLITIWLIFTVGTAPVCAMFYNGVSVYSTIYSALMVPIAAVLIIVSAPVLLVLCFFEHTYGINFASDLILRGIELFPRLADKLPFSFLQLRTPDFCEVIIFYLGWWIFLRAISGKIKIHTSKLLITVALAMVVSGFWAEDINTLSINFVNVGQGDGAVLHTSRGEVVIIDGGGAPDQEEGYNVGESVFVPYLISHGLTDIDVAILTHCHKDHAEGIVAAADKLKINTIVMPDAAADNKYRKELEALSQRRRIKIEYLGAGDKICFKSGLNIRFISPDKGQQKSDELNDSCLVAHVSYGDFDALFTGDSTDKISEKYPADVELLKVSHHGSDTSSDEEYIRHTSPEYAVISVGEDNSYGLPDYEVVDRLRRYGASVLRTDKLGDIRFKIRKDGKITYKSLRGG